MPAFKPTDVVLVTGANGHVGSHLCSQLLALEGGPCVRACVRAEASAAPLKQTFASYIAAGRLSFTDVPDITKPGVFDEALQGATHVAHVASPIVLDPQDVERDLLLPAINGTTSLLNSAKAVASIESIVVTSSFAAVHDPFRGYESDYSYSAADWNPLSYEQAAGREATTGIDPRYDGFKLYMGSKKHAEDQAWKAYDQARAAGCKWRFSTVLPTYIGGPCVLPLRGPGGTDGFSFSQNIILNVANARGNAGQQEDFPFWVDVRDVARAHVEALARPEAAGKRWILALGKVRYSDIARSLAEQFPQLQIKVVEDETEPFDVQTQDALADTGLGLGQYISLDEMVRDTIAPVLNSLGEY